MRREEILEQLAEGIPKLRQSQQYCVVGLVEGILGNARIESQSNSDQGEAKSV